jgi:hypothetical protein
VRKGEKGREGERRGGGKRGEREEKKNVCEGE